MSRHKHQRMGSPAQPKHEQERVSATAHRAKDRSWRHGLVVPLLLATITVLAYASVRHYGFVSLDDPTYITDNVHLREGLTIGSVKWAFTTGHAANWHPMTWLSHLVDVQAFGLQPGAHHVVSLLIHIANTLLLFWLLVRATGCRARAAFVAALFAVHPLHVESVAWVSERKDVLSTFFFLLTLLAYVRYAQERTAHLTLRTAHPALRTAHPALRTAPLALRTSHLAPRTARFWYLVVVLCLALGLMAKPMLVTVPFVLLLLDVWPLARTGGTWKAEGPTASVTSTSDSGLRTSDSGATLWALVREKLPLLALSIVSSAITMAVQRQGGAVAAVGGFPIARRLGNGVLAYWGYLAKTIWPVNLVPFYPYPQTISLLNVFAAALALAVITILAIRVVRTHPYVTVGWLWYLGMLVPVIGFLQVGRQAMADRYTYVPAIGLFVMVAWGVPDILRRWSRTRAFETAFLSRAAIGAAVAIVAACTLLTRAQAATWQSSRALWQHAVAVSPSNYYAQNALGEVLLEEDQPEEAARHFAESIRLDPGAPDAHHNLGLVLARQGRIEQAISEHRAAVTIDPAFAEAHNSLGAAAIRLGRPAEAVEHYARAIRLQPESSAFHANLGQALAALGRIAEAESELRRAIALDPANPAARDQLGLVLVGRGNAGEAIAEYTEALRINPGYADAHDHLGTLFTAQGKMGEAVAQFAEAVRLSPTRADFRANLGFAYAAQGKVDEAIAHFSEAVRLQPNFEQAQYYLGMALAGAGRPDEAIRAFTRVLDVNPRNEGARRALNTLAARRH